MRYPLVWAAASLVLAGCVTTPTPEEVAYCQDMERRMGTETTHDHAQMKGTGANPMNVSHERCQAILRDAD